MEKTTSQNLNLTAGFSQLKLQESIIQHRRIFDKPLFAAQAQSLFVSATAVGDSVAQNIFRQVRFSPFGGKREKGVSAAYILGKCRHATQQICGYWSSDCKLPRQRPLRIFRNGAEINLAAFYAAKCRFAAFLRRLRRNFFQVIKHSFHSFTG